MLRFDNFVVTPKPGIPTAIVAPEASSAEGDNASAPVRYYNLMGQPISSGTQPRGIYIRTQGGKSRVVVGPNR